MRQRIPRALKDKAVSSMKRAVSSFNGLDDDGRQTAVMLHLQHAFEMLLKGALREKRIDVFDKGTGRSIGLEKAVRLSQQHLSLTDDQAGLVRAIDALRDDEQHWIADVHEGLLYAHVKAGLTLFDEVLEVSFGERLADHLPTRVMPVSTEPIMDLQVMIDGQFKQVQDLLAPGRRRIPDARAKIRGLLAMEAHVAEDVGVSERDVDRVQRAVRAGKPIEEVFPRLVSLDTVTEGDGPTITVRFTKQKGVPVTFVSADDPGGAGAVREVDLQRKYHLSATALADRLKLTGPKATALRRHLSIDDDPACRYTFTFGALKLNRYSDNAERRMREALDTVDMDDVWRENRPKARPRKQRSSA